VAAGPQGVLSVLNSRPLIHAHLAQAMMADGHQMLADNIFLCPYPICEGVQRLNQTLMCYTYNNPWAHRNAAGSWISFAFITCTDHAPPNAAPGCGL
jgi:hypothetical protein